MKKILIVVHQLNIGGVQKSLITMLNAIDYSKNDVTLYVKKERLDLLKNVPKDVKVVINRFNSHHIYSLKQIVLAVFDKGTRLLHLNTQYKKAEKRYAEYLNNKQREFEISQYKELRDKYDIAIAYVQGDTAEFVSSNIVAGKKYVFWHGSTDENHELHQQIFNEYDAIIGVSPDVKNILQNIYPDIKDKVTYITNYVDPSAIIKLKDEYKVEKAKEGITLCSCGRFTEVKGFDIALEAAEKLKNDGVHFIWYLVGDGPERTKLQSYINERNLKDNVVITGLKKNPYPYIEACDIYVQPSREEAEPLVLQEAKILLKPVVTTATMGGNSNIVSGETGLITDFRGEDIALKIIALFQDIQLREKIKNNLEEINYDDRKLEYTYSVNALFE